MSVPYYLHVDQFDNVWIGYRDVAFDVCKVADVFRCKAMLAELRAATSVNVLGEACNAGLLLQLAENLAFFNYDLRVGSPVLFPKQWRDRHDITELLLYLQTADGIVRMSESWHDFTFADKIAYSLLASKSAATPQHTLLMQHPAADVFRYVRGNSDEKLVEFYNTVTDIRWFFHPQHRSRSSLLEAYLGVTPKNANHFLNPLVPGDLHTQRFIAVVSLWFRALGVTATTMFLRAFRADPCPRTLLRQTQQFLNLVRLIWCGYFDTPYHNRFQPEKFFTDPADLEEFQRNLSS